jgi:hypothetical protein
VPGTMPALLALPNHPGSVRIGLPQRASLLGPTFPGDVGPAQHARRNEARKHDPCDPIGVIHEPHHEGLGQCPLLWIRRARLRPIRRTW